MGLLEKYQIKRIQGVPYRRSLGNVDI